MASVLILMGSTSDWPVMQAAARMLEDLGVQWEARVVSAHRTPDLLATTMQEAEQSDVRVVIAGAGGAAPLAGHARSLYAFTRIWCSSTEQAIKRPRQFAFDCADAQRRCRRHPGSRRSGCCKCWLACSTSNSNHRAECSRKK